ncbi:MAG: hypothetical protein HY316_02255, partial [Acidobacteria bacterium]|nr:hypothetical protein [Acidobacteriota bacterium]
MPRSISLLRGTRGVPWLLMALLLVAPASWAAWGTATGTCTATEEPAADNSITCTVATANMAAGSVVVVWSATDNVFSSGQTTTHSISDSASNSYTRACEYTYSPGGIQADGATISVFYSKLTTGLTSGSSTITLTTSNTLQLVSKMVPAEAR